MSLVQVINEFEVLLRYQHGKWRKQKFKFGDYRCQNSGYGNNSYIINRQSMTDDTEQNKMHQNLGEYCKMNRNW